MRIRIRGTISPTLAPKGIPAKGATNYEVHIYLQEDRSE